MGAENSRKYRILCYGDSNTWGYISGTKRHRYGENERWTRLLSKKLGENFEVLEEGLNSRTLISEDTNPGKEGRNGFDYLIPCLDTNDPIDLVVIMLGTNELQTRFNRSIEEVGEIFEKYFVKTILNRKSQFEDRVPQLLIVAPPVAAQKSKPEYEGAHQKSLKFNEIYSQIAQNNNCYFVDNKGLTTGIDGLHLTKESHELLAEKIYEEISKISKNIFTS